MISVFLKKHRSLREINSVRNQKEIPTGNTNTNFHFSFFSLFLKETIFGLIRRKILMC